jgi:hypothetical protein
VEANKIRKVLLIMRRKVFAASFALLVTALVVAASFNYRAGQTVAAPRAASSASELLLMLPASDAVAFMDAQRAVTEVIPHIFTNDSETLARVNSEIDKFRDHTGTDARSFDSIAMAARFKQGSLATDFVVGLVRGRFNASEAITRGLAKAKAEAEAKKRRVPQWKEVQYEGTTIYTVDNSGGFCLAPVDANTIAFGDLNGIKAMLDARAGRAARVDSSLVELATLNASAVAGFAANIPAGTVNQFAGGGDEFGEAFKSIRQVYGFADANGANGTFSLALRSETNEQAQALAEKLSSLKQLAGLYMSKSKPQGNNDPAITTRVDVGPMRANMNALPLSEWIKDVTITAEGNDVRIRLEEPLTDIGGIFSGR